MRAEKKESGEVILSPALMKKTSDKLRTNLLAKLAYNKFLVTPESRPPDH